MGGSAYSLQRMNPCAMFYLSGKIHYTPPLII
jgi:hypothetical protein